MPVNRESSLFANYVQHILRWEGKTSKDPRDTAAKCYPGGIHTNKGVTFCTFKQLAPVVGISPVTHDRFLKLTDQDVGRILFYFYQQVRGDQVPDSVGLAMTEAAWGSGTSRAFQHLRDSVKALGKPGISTSQAIASARQIPEKQLFAAYQQSRQAFLNNLGANPKYSWALKGWLNRLGAFNKLFTPIATILPLFFLGLFLLVAKNK